MILRSTQFSTIHIIHHIIYSSGVQPSASNAPGSEDPVVNKVVVNGNEKEAEEEKAKEKEKIPTKAYRDFVERNKRNSKVEENMGVKDLGRETSPNTVAGVVNKDSHTPSVTSHARTNATAISTDNGMSTDTLIDDVPKESEISPNLMKNRSNGSILKNEEGSEYSKYVFSNRSKRNSAVDIVVPENVLSEQQKSSQSMNVEGEGDLHTPERTQNVPKNIPGSISTTPIPSASPARNVPNWIKEGNVPHWVRNGSGSESGSGSPNSQFKLKSRDGSFRGISPPRNGSRTKDEVKERESEKEMEKEKEKKIEEDGVREAERVREVEKEKEKEKEREIEVERKKEVEREKEKEKERERERERGGSSVENGSSSTTPIVDETAAKAAEPQATTTLTPTKTREKGKTSDGLPKKKRIILDADTQRLCSQAETFRREGGEYYSKEDYLKALASFEKSLHLGPKAWGNRPTVLGNRAATFMMLGR